MLTRLARLSLLGLASACLAGCGSSSATGHAADSGPSDANIDVGARDSGAKDAPIADSTVPVDSGAGDAPAGEDADASPPADTGAADTGAAPPGDASFPPPKGTPIATGDLQVWGVTGDGFIVYSDETAATLYAIPQAGGTPRTIATALGAGHDPNGVPTHAALVQGDVVLLWTGLVHGATLTTGSLAVWTSAAASPIVVGASSLVGVAQATADSAHVAYLDDVDPTAGTATYSEATIATGQTTQLVAGVDLTNGTCTVTGQPAASTFFVLRHCERPSSDAAPEPTYVSAFAVATGQRTDLLATTTVPHFTVNAAGTQVLALFDPGLEVFTLGATPPTGVLIDANAASPQVVDAAGLFTPDGLGAIYLTASGGLKTSPLHSPAPVLLQSAFADLFAVSPDGTRVAGCSVMGCGSGGSTQILLASATTDAPFEATAFPGDDDTPVAFTTDSSQLLYEKGAVGLYALSSAAGTIAQLGSGDFADVMPTGASSAGVAFSTLTGTVVHGDALADIFWSNAGASAVATSIASGAAFGPGQLTTFFLTAPSSSQSIVFTWTQEAGPQSGLYVTPVP